MTDLRIWWHGVLTAGLVAIMAAAAAADGGLAWSTFLGGSSEDRGRGVAVDSAGNVLVIGTTIASDFPATAGSHDPVYSGEGDIFLAKFSPDGSNLIYMTFIGGRQDHEDGVEGGDGIAVDDDGNVYLTGWTSATDFPVTAGAFDRTF